MTRATAIVYPISSTERRKRQKRLERDSRNMAAATEKIVVKLDAWLRRWK